MMTLFVGFLLVSTLLCALVTGFVFTYAVVVMPGFAKLDDREFIHAFQMTDGVIQNNQPLFMLAWVGSIVSIVATMVLGFIELHGTERWTIIAIGVVYLMGVQGITILIHLALNNSLQRVEIDKWIQNRYGGSATNLKRSGTILITSLPFRLRRK